MGGGWITAFLDLLGMVGRRSRGGAVCGALAGSGRAVGALAGAPRVSGALSGAVRVRGELSGSDCCCAEATGMNPIPIGGDYVLSLTGLTGGGAPLNAATVTYVLRAPDGSDAGSGALAYVDGSNGDYSAVVESTVTAHLVAGRRYRVEVTITQDGYDDYREVPVAAVTRGRV